MFVFCVLELLVQLTDVCRFKTVKVFGRARKQLCFVQELTTRVPYLQLCKLGDKFKPIAGRPREAWQIAKEKSKHGLKHVKKTNMTSNQKQAPVGNWLSEIHI